MKKINAIIASAAILVGLTAFAPGPASAQDRAGVQGQIVKADHRGGRNFNDRGNRSWNNDKRHWDRRDYRHRHDFRYRHPAPRPLYRHPGGHDRFGIFWQWNGRIH